ncbi:sugar transferase [Bacillus benzoevorans]|uniref:Lipopolysaccharide/colanic/teichoic acid biosynthesis glycosyltransferase n=1 Tax=Bacillus benzoevorans TaxID=1456 RepID=A0A7X0HWD1_9BACI|nr:sugar transferase [Bacillus benzoevorans]MBB6446840.1 lipopolysaccharide/colanic/teichoic acid biosynthesis glycosyltransferase [Bacillus benzoevorans]
MVLKKWHELPPDMRNEQVRPYYAALRKRRWSLLGKRLFDVAVSIGLLSILSPAVLAISIWIKWDSKGPVFFRQVRVTQYGKKFKIFKFRTMVKDAEKMGSQVTTKNDTRVTKAGAFLRKYRMDELPQLLNILRGDMTLVGTRPEVEKYVACYSEEMMATLLLPAGVTSEASILYKDEEVLLAKAADVDQTYMETILPRKMKLNLLSLKKFSFFGEIKILAHTGLAVFFRKRKAQISTIDWIVKEKTHEENM